LTFVDGIQLSVCVLESDLAGHRQDRGRTRVDQKVQLLLRFPPTSHLVFHGPQVFRLLVPAAGYVTRQESNAPQRNEHQQVLGQ